MAQRGVGGAERRVITLQEQGQRNEGQEVLRAPREGIG
jgi:hypothetical protein